MSRSKLSKTVLLMLLLLLPACVTVNSCPPIKPFSPEYREALATEIEAMAAFPNAIEAITDLIVLREQCGG